MKRLLISLTLIVVVIILFVGGNVWWSKSIEPVSSDTSKQRFIIPKGYSAMQVANKLEDNGLIKSSLAFKFYTQLTNKAGKIQAGEFDMSPSNSLIKTVDILLSGPVELWVTIPEGLRREEIALRFADSLEKEGIEYTEFVDQFIIFSEGEEGYLFPDTYLSPKMQVYKK